ncbi:hypothetical protein [Rubrivivax gelatinosus]|uniref:hypothetical protein n=1 Tax=Rubrivivax gelatinosus TaxID=28068 RepID=UPI0009DAFFB6|nr:hypothetical protein [Rubrivivax gelatinosus]MBG6083014.1 hypothetical protein [Rubrivivax gelatinosus]
MTQANQPSGLRIWERVQATDPAFTRSFTSSAGFSGTAIAPIYLACKATEVFGPFGIGWGIDLLEGSERFIEGAPIGYDADGRVAVRTIVHSGRFELWYMLDGQRGSVRHWGSTTFVGRSGDAIVTNEDAQKMSQTDAMSKCLSLLGFGADVHMGLFDDAKYVAGLEAAIASGQLSGVNLQPTATRKPEAHQPQHQAPDHGSSQLSKRYHTYRNRMKEGPVDDVRAARAVIEQDKGLSDIEKALLLSSKELAIEAKVPPPSAVLL